MNARNLKPLSPVHLRAAWEGSDIRLSWIRRTRAGGDSWEGDVPLSETSERYRLSIYNGASVVREIETTSAEHLYLAADITADFGGPGPGASLDLAVAQLSDAVGEGIEGRGDCQYWLTAMSLLILYRQKLETIMVKSNEFTAATLVGAVKKATAAYQKPERIEQKSYCRDLRNRFDFRKLQADDLFDRIIDLRRDVERLKGQARDAQIAAAISALVTVGGALGTAARAISKIRRLKLGRFTKRDLLDLLPVIGGALGIAASTASAASALKEAKNLEKEIERLTHRYDQMADELMGLVESYENSNCH